jgi:hypothetical protein
VHTQPELFASLGPHYKLHLVAKVARGLLSRDTDMPTTLHHVLASIHSYIYIIVKELTVGNAHNLVSTI